MSLVLNTIEAFPRGRTTQELFALLDVNFDHARRLSVQSELIALQQNGVITLGRDKKWRGISRRIGPSGNQNFGHGTGKKTRSGDEMIASPAQFETNIADQTEEGDVRDNTRPNPNRLIHYYRAALQSDPRGALTQADDRHGTSFQLLCGQGNFIPQENEQGTVRVKLEKLPDAFREAVFRREANENALAIGWPISMGKQNGVPAIRPVGLIAATWERDEKHLLVHISANDILINPDWIKAAARHSAWSENALREVFIGQGGSGLKRDDFLVRLREAGARAIRGTLNGRDFVTSLEPADEGIFDALGLFLPSSSSFTAGAVRDLDEIGAWEPAKLARTALAPLLGLEHDSEIERCDPINVGPLNLEQIQSVENALSSPLSVVTGPPGTGKSQAIVAMVATAILRGQSVVVASKNHQALDAVQERLQDIASDVPFVIRTLDAEKGVDKSVTTVLENLVRDPSGKGAAEDPEACRRLWSLASTRSRALKQIAKKRAINLRLADNIERLQLREDAGVVGKTTPSTTANIGFIGRIWNWLLGWRSVITEEDTNGRLTTQQLRTQITQDRAKLPSIGMPDDPVILTGDIQDLARNVLKKHIKARIVLDSQDRAKLSNAYDDLALAGKTSISREITETVLYHRPLWLASVLGTPKRLPLYDGLFDLVIFDEASQCDIASALPLLARSKRAVIVGDDRQLAFISQIGAAQDRNLMAAQGLPATGMGRFAQGRKSLFDFANTTPDVVSVMLCDQYRSAEGIVDYINGNFYGGKLRVSADPEGFKVPDGAKAGLCWSDVPGQASPFSDRPNVNPAEVKAITAHVKELLQYKDYTGSVGVISPFRVQVAALQQALRNELSEDLWKQASLRVATVDGFQGQERDIILFSPVVNARSSSTAITFLQRDWRRLNVAISRARAVAYVFGDLAYARAGGIKSLARLAARATAPRKHQGESMFDSEWERITYHAMRDRGLDPTPQYDIAGRRLDFALFGTNGVKLDLEVDGRRWHQDIDGNRKLDDHWRDHQMKSLGWKVRRFWVDELKQDMEQCLDIIEADLG